MSPSYYSGLYICDQDIDWFYLPVCSGGSISVSIYFSGGDVELELYDSNFNKLAHSTTSTDNEFVSHTATSASTENLFIKVFEFGTTSVFYTLEIEVIGCSSSCRAGQYALSSGCASCPSGKYQDQNIHTSSSCKSQRTCGTNQYVSSAGSSTSDLVCTSCPSGKYQDQTSHTSSTCVEKSQCDLGYACGVGQHTNSDCNRCFWCSAGKFEEAVWTQAVDCASCSTSGRVCAAGQYQSGCGRGSPGECVSCPVGHFQDASSHRQTSCKGKPACAAGSFSRSGDSLTSDRICTRCPSGKYQDQSIHTSSSCKSQRTCGTNQYVSSAGSSTSDLVCISCPSGKYQDQTSHTSSTCKTQLRCGPGQYAQFNNQMVVCRACPALTYQNDASHQQSACKPQPPCTAGELASDLMSKESERECLECPPSEFQANDRHFASSCYPFETCGLNEYLSQEGTSTSDRLCRQCPPNTYQNSSDHTATECQSDILSFICDQKPMPAIGILASHYLAGTADYSNSLSCSKPIPIVAGGCVVILCELLDVEAGDSVSLQGPAESIPPTSVVAKGQQDIFCSSTAQQSVVVRKVYTVPHPWFSPSRCIYRFTSQLTRRKQPSGLSFSTSLPVYRALV